MPDEFVALASFLRTPRGGAPADAPVLDPEPPVAVLDAAEEERFEALAEVRRFRAALADALHVAVASLLEDVAAEVLARELRLAPADVGAIVRETLARRGGEMPLRVRAHARDVPLLEELDLPVAVDEALRRGDVVLELRSGTIEASLGARLESAIARAAA